MNSKLHHDIKQENELQNLSIYILKSIRMKILTTTMIFNRKRKKSVLSMNARL